MCGYPRCLDYASAIVTSEANIDRCPPGGVATIELLADLINRSVVPPAVDVDPFLGRQIAQIREEDCIGCALCIKPCPVDAIVGTAKHMHSVLLADCTGCRICLEYCPVDCIEMIPFRSSRSDGPWEEFSQGEIDRWRVLADRHFLRLETETKDAQSATDESLDYRSEMQNSVNRERQRVWKQKRRQQSIQQSD